ncbi:MAG: hypothetical protein R2684_02000 [Pyrinomonadaceae bacterium]
MPLTKSAEKSGIELNVCVACGGSPIRSDANFCSVCGKSLSEDYYPLDSFRSSHHKHGQTFLVENRAFEVEGDLFSVNRNAVSETAWASCVYSMVPFLGIVFVPFTILIGAIGLGLGFKNKRSGGIKLSAASLGLSLPIAVIQLTLWWLLYIVPELGRTI